MKGSTRRDRGRRGAEPTPKRAAAAAAQTEHGNQLRAWLADPKRAKAKAKKAAKRARKNAPKSRGVDRVPAALRVQAPDPEWLVRHRPTRHPENRRWVKGLPYQNLDKRPSRTAGRTRR